MVAFVQDRYGLSEETARRRLDVERAAGRLHDMVSRRWSEQVGGMWLNDAGEETTVTIAFTESDSDREAALRRQFEYPETLRFAVVPNSVQRLTALLTQIVADRDRLQSGDATDLPASLAATEGRFDVSIEPRHNRVVVSASDADEQLRNDLRDYYGSPTIEVDSSVMQPFCSREDCRYTMRGGLHLRFGTAPGCTSAFPVRGASGRVFVLSAGHCGGSPDTGGSRNNGGVQYGTVDGDAVRDRVDAERIVRTNASWAHSNGVFLSSTSFQAITSVALYGNLLPGTTVQASLRSGDNPITTIVSTNYSPWWVPNSSNFLTTLTCFGTVGDSGSPFFRGSEGVGILSGGTGGVGLQGCVVFGALEFALQELHVSLL